MKQSVSLLFSPTRISKTYSYNLNIECKKRKHFSKGQFERSFT